MGIIEKKALKKIRGKRSACMKKENRKGNKLQLLRTRKLSHWTPFIVEESLWDLHVKTIEKSAVLWMNESVVGKQDGFP